MKKGFFSGPTACAFLTAVFGLSSPAAADDDDDRERHSERELCFDVTGTSTDDAGILRLQIHPSASRKNRQVSGVWDEEESDFLGNPLPRIVSPITGAAVTVEENGQKVVKMALTETGGDIETGGETVGSNVSATTWYVTLDKRMRSGRAGILQTQWERPPAGTPYLETFEAFYTVNRVRCSDD